MKLFELFVFSHDEPEWFAEDSLSEELYLFSWM
jgi:hypothetical protein